MWRPARCGSATTSSSLATGPATSPAAFRASQASRLEMVPGPGLQSGPDVRLEMVEPALGRGEARVVGPLRPADGAGQVGPLVRPQHLQHEPAVGGPEAVEDPRPRRPHRHAHGPEVRHDVEHGHQGVEHGDVDALAPAGAVALAQGGLGADDGEEPVTMSPSPPMGEPIGGWPSGRLNS